jgi:flagellin-like hook-associated protein FlgL
MRIAGTDTVLSDIPANRFENYSYTTTVSFIAEDITESLKEELDSLWGGDTNRGYFYTLSPNATVNIAITESDIGYAANETTIGAVSAQSYVRPGLIDSTRRAFLVASAGTSPTMGGYSSFGARALASAINHNEDSQFWAMYEEVVVDGASAEMCYIFTKKGGDFNGLLACEVADGDAASLAAAAALAFENLESGDRSETGTTFSLGGQFWATMKPNQTKANLGNEVWNITLNGRDVGNERDIRIANENEIATPGLAEGVINGMDRNSFVEIQNAADGPWAGAEVRTQSAAQAALDAITEAINTKDKIRADLGALQNRLENTMTNLTIQAENLQASESRISDVDVATEMTEFTRNNVLSQAATSMLAQANSLSQLALSLIR